MKLAFIPLDKLTISPTNMRTGKKPPDIANILPSVRKRGVLQTLLVRPNCAPDSFEIVAGKRRFYAALAVANENAPPTRCHARSSRLATMPRPLKPRLSKISQGLTPTR